MSVIQQPPGAASVAEVEQSATRGFAVRLGWGRRPAILVVDFSRGFTSPDLELGSDLGHPIAATLSLLEVGRRHHVPIVFTSIAFTPKRLTESLFVQKVPAMRILLANSPAVQLDPRLERAEGEHLIFKEYPSAFAGTTLASTLVTSGVDTLLVAGCSTSGCIRATVVDALTYGFRPVVVEECVGDRWGGSHALALAEMASKYADVVSLSEATAQLENFGQQESAPARKKAVKDARE